MNDKNGGSQHILVVDDDRESQRLLVLILGRMGFAMNTAGGGKEAFAKVAEHLPDLIILDYMMPDMDGYEVAAQLKSNAASANVPLLMITAMDDAESRRRGIAAGIHDFLAKPVDHVELRARVQQIFAR